MAPCRSSSPASPRQGRTSYTRGFRASSASGSYIFITQGAIGASIILDGQGNVLTAAHSVSRTPTSVEEAPRSAFRVVGNYPNPFGDATRIAFDLSGREVAGLIDGTLSRGAHAAAFRADELPSGVYVYRLQVDGAVSTRSLVVRR